MSNITPFSYEDHEVRVLDVDGEPWFVLADLCKVLGLSNPAVVAKRLDEADVSQAYISPGGQRRAMTIVSEPGMYDVVVRSDSPLAKPFRRWVTHEVLPQIRRTGAYATTPAPQLSEDEIIHQALQIGENDSYGRQDQARIAGRGSRGNQEGRGGYGASTRALQRGHDRCATPPSFCFASRDGGWRAAPGDCRGCRGVPSAPVPATRRVVHSQPRGLTPHLVASSLPLDNTKAPNVDPPRTAFGATPTRSQHA